MMNSSQKIRMALAFLGITEAELSRRIGSSPQAFHQRMKTGKWSDSDWEKISEALGCEIVFEFRFPDGTTV